MVRAFVEGGEVDFQLMLEKGLLHLLEGCYYLTDTGRTLI